MTEIRASRLTAAPDFDPGLCQAAARRYILIAAILASALGFIDGTVVSIAMPAMRETLGADLAQAQWISNAYMLTLSALILTGGALGDRFGLSRVFAFGIGLFIAASLACAVAPGPDFLIAARAVQGVGAAFMVPGSLAIISRAYPADERGRAIGIWAAASAMTTALGPIVGGLALTLGGPGMWRWIFAINLPLGALALWLLLSRVEADRTHRENPVDLAGAALATAGLGLIAWSLTGVEGGGEGPANALYLALAGVAVLIIFLVQETRAPAPMMPLSLFASRTFSAANLSTFFLYFSLSAILFFLPMTVIAGWGVSEIEASAAFVPLTVFITLFSARAGKLADRVGPGRMIGTGAAVTAIAFAALALTMGYQAFWWAVIPAMCLMGVGMSLVVAPLSAAVMGAIDDSQSGAASGVNNAISRIAGLVAVAAMGSLAAIVYTGAGGGLSFGETATAPGHVAAMNAAFAAIAWVTAGLSALSAVIAFGWIGRPQTGS